MLHILLQITTFYHAELQQPPTAGQQQQVDEHVERQRHQQQQFAPASAAICIQACCGACQAIQEL